jgi:hypothetical protein
MTLWDLIGSVPWLGPVIVLGGLILALGVYKLAKDWLPW